MFAKEVYGEFREQTHVREKYVTTMMVKKWMEEEGLTPAQVALRWNAGGAKQCSRGVNSQGVAYDSCAHVAKVLSYLGV